MRNPFQQLRRALFTLPGIALVVAAVIAGCGSNETPAPAPLATPIAIYTPTAVQAEVASALPTAQPAVAAPIVTTEAATETTTAATTSCASHNRGDDWDTSRGGTGDAASHHADSPRPCRV
ncbi:MAG: hypothetical protein IPK16_06165 [Anaerolineales bacterium]|nr:hypothetical protein [Anaerolineales bacterium]